MKISCYNLAQWFLFYSTNWMTRNEDVTVQGKNTCLTNQAGRESENIPLEKEMPASSLSFS